ncbi:unnamed protein product [Knipowitschia caucasica]
MGDNEALREVLLEITSDKTSLEKLKWSVGISLRWIISQLHSLDKYKVMELMHKSSEECFHLAMKILESQGNPVALKAPEAKDISEYTWKMFLHVQSLTWDEYNTFVSSMGEELEQIWKRRLDAADQSQTVQLVETLFHQDPIAFSLILEEMCALKVIQKFADAKGAGGASEVFGKLSDRELDKLRPYLKYYLPHISSHELKKTGGDGIVRLMEKNAHLSFKEMIEKVLKRMDRTDLVWRLSPPSEQQDPPSEQQDPPSEQQDPSSEQQDPPSEQQDPPSEQQDPPSEQQDPPSEQQDPPSEQQDPPSDQPGDTGSCNQRVAPGHCT